MEKVLIFIKHNFSFLWKLIEWTNGHLFALLYQSGMQKILTEVLYEFQLAPFLYRKLDVLDLATLKILILEQDESDLTYFRAHSFDPVSLLKQYKNKSFLMMGVFKGEKMVGYFFLRFFANRKCFVGRIIDKEYRGKGIGLVMNDIMYETAWRIKFRCLSTISRNNNLVMKAHKKNHSMVVIKELQNDYFLVEFLRVNEQANNEKII